MITEKPSHSAQSATPKWQRRWILPVILSWVLPVILILLCASGAILLHSRGTPMASGPARYGGDPGGTRFYQATQITAGNAAALQVAWDIRTGDAALPAGQGAAFECQPLVCAGHLVVITPSDALLALDPVSGRTLWRFEPPGQHAAGNNRGCSLWHASEPDAHPDRLLYPAGHFVYEVDGQTGESIAGFGQGGRIDIARGLSRGHSRMIVYNSPPLVAGNLVLCGSQIGDNVRADAADGAVRAFDVHTGALVWTFRPLVIRPGGPGAANVWSLMSCDPSLGRIYLPTTSPSNDSYGGTRPGPDPGSDSLTCLDLATGKRLWAQQLVHHDLWDYDLPAEPVLFDYQQSGRTVRGVAQVTKMGRMFLFDRVSGKPLFPLREISVPASDVPGEAAAPTQPMPGLPPPLVPQGISPADAWGKNPGDMAAAKMLLAAHRTGPAFTPPSFEGTVQMPGLLGGCNWSGAAYDPKSRLLVTTTNTLPLVVTLYPRGQAHSRHGFDGDGGGAMLGTPYEVSWDFVRTPDGLPRVRPPWGTIAAVDPLTGRIAWQHPLGWMPQAAGVPGYKDFGSPSFGGAITTASGLTLVAGTLDHHLRVLDTRTGREIAALPLPAGGESLPIIYTVAGKEYLCLCCGGHWMLGDPFSDHVVAFALP